jgi:uncharacterized Tic20 family protein
VLAASLENVAGPEQSAPTAVRDDERTWAMLAHLGGIVLLVVVPLVLRQTAGRSSPFVRDQATEALNFQLTVLVAALVSLFCWVILVGIVMSAVVGIGSIVLTVIAAIHAHRGERYRYPVAARPVH